MKILKEEIRGYRTIQLVEYESFEDYLRNNPKSNELSRSIVKSRIKDKMYKFWNVIEDRTHHERKDQLDKLDDLLDKFSIFEVQSRLSSFECNRPLKV